MKDATKHMNEILALFDAVNGMPKPNPSRLHRKKHNGVRIPVIFSSSDLCSKFVAICGVSILYNTNAFIEFYILCDGITDSNKEHIRESFSAISSCFSVQFIDVNAVDYFSFINLPRNAPLPSKTYYVSITCCNRLLIPKLLPHLEKAVYFDVDIIFMGDIQQLWDENLGDHFIGAVPLYIDRYSMLERLRTSAKIPSDPDHVSYKYFNSGVLLIDYKKWREVEGSNDAIVKKLISITENIGPKMTPDEMVLNNYAFNNGCYKILDQKYNCHSYYSYEYLRSAKFLTKREKDTLNDFEKGMQYFFPEGGTKLTSEICIHHFYGPEKPWEFSYGLYMPIPRTVHFDDFWFYAKLTPFYNDLRINFITRNLPKGTLESEGENNIPNQSAKQVLPKETPESERENNISIQSTKRVLREIILYPDYKRKLKRLGIKILLSWGKRRQRYLQRREELRKRVMVVEELKNGGGI